MKALYPPIKPFAQHKLEVDSLHKIYIEECGEKGGLPILFVHGGPGAGCSTDDRRFFDPSRYHIILFDQRGCGQSTPHGELENNTTEHLIADIEAIREHLGIKRWILFGGSWGSTLSLLYAQRYPDRVMGMILRGTFLGRQQDLDWSFKLGASRVFPDYWEEFLSIIPKVERNDIISAYYKRLTNSDEIARMGAAKHWAQYEGQCATLQPSKSAVTRFTNPHIALTLARMETHYFVNKCFIEENQILKNASKLENIPGIIIHGRYDMICPLDNSLALHQAWPRTELHIIRDAGHSPMEPGIASELVNSTLIMARYHE